MKQLTKTETKVAHHVALGFAEKEIADKLFVSVHTIHAHTKNIRKKLNARNIADVTRLYILSLEDPKLILKALFFVVLQLGIMFHSVDVNAMRPGVRISARAKTKTKTREYVN